MTKYQTRLQLNHNNLKIPPFNFFSTSNFSQPFFPGSTQCSTTNRPPPQKPSLSARHMANGRPWTLKLRKRPGPAGCATS